MFYGWREYLLPIAESKAARYGNCRLHAGSRNRAVFTWRANQKYFLFHSSHQIFERMYEALNVGKKITNCIVYL
jgi:hypothetical protein